MGNLCSKGSPNFKGEGRTLGSSATDNVRPAAPADVERHNQPAQRSALQGSGRKLGGGAVQAGGDDPRSAAAKAAEQRAAAHDAKTTKAQRVTNRTALQEASYAERRARDADQMADARAWN